MKGFSFEPDYESFLFINKGYMIIFKKHLIWSLDIPIYKNYHCRYDFPFMAEMDKGNTEKQRVKSTARSDQFR